MEYDVYFDESGDLGWKLNEEFRKNGSSQFFTIAYIILPTGEKKHLNRFMKKFHRERGGREKEIKGASFSNKRTRTIARNIMSLLERYQDMTIGAVTVRKNALPDKLINTDNDHVLYDYMVQLGICSKIAALDSHRINIIPDKRSVPNGSQNSCFDLLKGKLWLEFGADAEISYQPEESHNNVGLMFIDWIANFVWRNYENNTPEAYQILSKRLEENNLFL